MISKLSRIFIVLLTLNSCIGEDVIDDFVEAELRVLNPISEISLSDTYQFSVSYFDNVGAQNTSVEVVWTSSDETIAVISNSGLLSPISIGSVLITASVITDNATVNEEFLITVIEGETTTENESSDKSGTIRTTSSYLLEGSFVISEIEGGDDLRISIAEDYRASTSLPGLYLYLSNNPNSIGDAYEVGAVSTFNGSHEYVIPNTGINEFSYLLYWCKPFNVKVGDGEILDN